MQKHSCLQASESRRVPRQSKSGFRGTFPPSMVHTSVLFCCFVVRVKTADCFSKHYTFVSLTATTSPSVFPVHQSDFLDFRLHRISAALRWRRPSRPSALLLKSLNYTTVHSFHKSCEYTGTRIKKATFKIKVNIKSWSKNYFKENYNNNNYNNNKNNKLLACLNTVKSLYGLSYQTISVNISILLAGPHSFPI